MKITKEQVIENLDEVKKILAELDSHTKTEEIKYIEIKNRWTGSVIYKSLKTTWKEAVKEAIEKGTNLTGANLTDTNLTGTNLTGANLTGANLTGANLTGANLTGANLTGADLTDTDLTDADLTDADLTACLFYFGSSYNNFASLCKAIKTIKHPDGKFEDLIK